MGDIAKIAAGIIVGGVVLFLLFIIVPASIDAADCARRHGTAYCRAMLDNGHYVSGR